jgi:hypothetical protein
MSRCHRIVCQVVASSGLLSNEFEAFLDQRKAMVIAVFAEVTEVGVGV